MLLCCCFYLYYFAKSLFEKLIRKLAYVKIYYFRRGAEIYKIGLYYEIICHKKEEKK